MSLLKQILSPFVEFDDEKKKGVAASEAPITPKVPTPVTDDPIAHPLINGANANVFTQKPTTTPRTNLAKPLPEHEQYFKKLIDEANANNPMFTGTDYKEFIDSKSDIDNITDEETRYKTAFNILKRTGLTKEKLIATAQEYHHIVGRDLNAFQSAQTQQYQKEVKHREQLIQKKAEELQALSEKVNALKKDISQLSQEMVDTKEKLNLTKNSFLLAGENLQSEIQEELQKIEKYF